MLRNNKHVFWQALIVTILIFLLGLVIGVYFEQLRSDKANVMFHESEAALYDSFALSEVISNIELSCDEARPFLINFADRVYEEAKFLERYDESEKISQSMRSLHKKFDLLRTILWINIIDFNERCETDTVVYFYIYDAENIETRSRQTAFSKVLRDLKIEEGNTFILIPIAVDQDIISLNYLLQNYNVSQFPSILINEDELVTSIPTVQSLREILNR